MFTRLSKPTDGLCYRDSGYGTLQCRWAEGGCPGATYNNCYPNALWAGTQSGSLYYIGNLNNGIFYARVPNEERVDTIAHGVRCVLDLGQYIQK